jgi:ABC-2 type transport system permease protein
MFRRVFAQARKELTQIRRDRLALTMALLLPLALLLLLSNAISLTVNDLPLIVQDFDSSSASRSYIDAFRASVTFRVVAWPVEREPESALKAGAARAALIIPEHFGRDLARGRTANVQLLIDAADANTAKLVNGYAGQITRAFAGQSAGSSRAALVTPQIRLWFNPGRASQKFYAPGIFVLGISMFPPLLATLAMAKEGDQKTILQVYVSSITAHEFLLGKILAFMIIALLEWAISLTVLLTVFGLHLTGDPSAFFVATILYVFCVSTFGSMVGAAVPNQAAAIQAVALGGFLLVFLLSGLLFPVENIPAGLRWISNIVWGRYYIEIVRDALLQGGGWPAMWFNVMMIGIIGSVFYLIAWRNMRPMQVKA